MNVFVGASFLVKTDRDLHGLEQGGFSFRRGDIFNAAGTRVGTYEYFSPFDRVLTDARDRTAPGVNLAAGALAAFGAVVAPVPMAIAGCVASWAGCRSSPGGMAMALSTKAVKILGKLAGQSATTVARMIRLRGSGGSQINKVATDLQNLPLGEVAERAARGDEAAKTAVEVVKDAKRLGQKY
jgi:hypothetical protein